jgi:hypothetical protein
VATVHPCGDHLGLERVEGGAARHPELAAVGRQRGDDGVRCDDRERPARCDARGRCADVGLLPAIDHQVGDQTGGRSGHHLDGGEARPSAADERPVVASVAVTEIHDRGGERQRTHPGRLARAQRPQQVPGVHLEATLHGVPHGVEHVVTCQPAFVEGLQVVLPRRLVRLPVEGEHVRQTEPRGVVHRVPG